MKKVVLLIIIAISLIGCSVNDGGETHLSNHVFDTIIDSDQFKNAPLDPLTINRLETQHDMLEVTFSADGCSGETWQVNLVTSHFILESKPPQRELVLSLKNDEPCDSRITRNIIFNISNLQLEDVGGKIWLNIKNADTRILYEY